MIHKSFATLFFFICFFQSGNAAKKPNIISILVDDLGCRDLGYTGSTFYETPHIDALHAEGIELTRHYAYKFCSPTRSSFLSGRLPIHVNEVNKITEAPLGGIHPNMTTMPRVLKEAGYISHHIGKWVSGAVARPLRRAIVSTVLRDVWDRIVAGF